MIEPSPTEITRTRASSRSVFVTLLILAVIFSAAAAFWFLVFGRE
ncbi:hypothetical protein BH11MYX2_BH11MYX2_02590 [soil metagenome]